MKRETKTKIIKISVIIITLLLLVLAIYLPLKLTGAINKIDSTEALKEIILSWGAYGYILFIIIQFLQVTFVPLPAAITTIAGTLVFGPWITLGLSLFAVWLGSAFAYFLGKKVGRKLVVWVIGESDALKWEERLKKGKYVYFLMMLFPFFPDDILCIVAGCVNMEFKFFALTNLITRPITLGITCFLGSGTLIPFSGWGIPVWIVLILIMVLLFYLSIKYERKIEESINALSNKLAKAFGKKDKNKKTSEVEAQAAGSGVEKTENYAMSKEDKEQAMANEEENFKLKSTESATKGNSKNNAENNQT